MIEGDPHTSGTRRTDHGTTRRSASHLASLGLASALLLGAPCQPFSTISISTPIPGFVVDDPSVSLTANVSTAFGAASVEVRIDGVDLIDALGLVPPFINATGTVSIDGQPVQVSGFTYNTAAPGNPKLVSAFLTGLPEGTHDVAVSGVRTSNGQLVTDLHPFLVTSPLGLALDVVPASANRAGATGGAGALAYGTTGGPLAGTPVGLSDGGALRPGFVHAAEGRIAQSP